MSTPALLAVARQVRTPTLLVPLGKPEELDSLEAVVRRVRELAAGRPLSFGVGAISHPDLDTFFGIVAKVDGGIVAAIGDRWNDAEDARFGARMAEAMCREVRP